MENKQKDVNKTWLQNMNWKQVKNYIEGGKNLVLLPIGSTEQHGYHLPLGNDTMIAIKISEDAAKKTNSIITPPLWFGWSPQHLAFPGTISIRAEVLIEILSDMINSLSAHGFKKFVVINGHRVTNIPWMQIAAERAQRELHVNVDIFDPAWMIKEIAEKMNLPLMSHADEIETSHLLYIRKELVNLNKAVDYVPELKKPHYFVDPRSKNDTLCTVTKTKEDTESSTRISGGSVGKPSRASVEKGGIIHNHLVKRLVEVIKAS